MAQPLPPPGRPPAGSDRGAVCGCSATPASTALDRLGQSRLTQRPVDHDRTPVRSLRADGETPIKITIADTVITARLADNATARDLAAQLPLTLTFKDFNQVEKIATLPRPLSMDGVPAGADPDIGDIGYYAPSGDLVFYYGDVGYWNGIVRIGRFDTTMELIEHQDDNFQVTIERS